MSEKSITRNLLLKWRIFHGLMACSAAMACPYQAVAQSTGTPSKNVTATPTDDAGNGEIVVTATRQALKLDKVPLSVAAYTQKTLDAEHVEQVEDLSRITPGLTFTRSAFAAGDTTNISIRGISSTTGAATTGIYIDDTPIQIRQIGTDANNAYPRIFDLERIEVLRGPQGTLFGAGSEGGTVRFITPQPSLTDYTAYGRSEIAGTEHGAASGEVGLALGGPIVQDQLGFRVSGWYRHDGGYIDRVNYPDGGIVEPNANYTNTLVLRGALGWSPASGLLITPSVLYQDLRTHDASTYWEQFSDPSKTEFRNAAVIQQPNNDRYVLPSLKIEYKTGNIKIISDTSYFIRNNNGVKDYTTFDEAAITLPAPNPLYYPLTGAKAPSYYYDNQNVFTQEVRIESADPSARLNYVLGVFYQNARQSTGQSVQDNAVDAIIADAYGPGLSAVDIFGVPVLPGGYTFVDALQSRDREIAGFGQVDFKLVPSLTFTAGVRVARTSFVSEQVANGPANGGPSDTTGSENETPVTPKFGISWQADQNNLFYVSAAKGFRIGGANTPIPNSICGPALEDFGYSSAPTSYKSDSVWSYEAGAKSRFFGGRLQTDVSAFHIDWDNIQSQVQLQCGFSFTSNLGHATSNGFDLSIRGQISSELTIGGTVGYTDAVYSKSIVGTFSSTGAPESYVIHAGDSLGATPWSFNIYGDYQHPVSARISAFLHFDLQYSSRLPEPYNNADASYDPTIPGQPALTNLNIRIGIRRAKIEVAAFATNLTNSTPELNRSHANFQSPLFEGITVRPRTLGLNATFRY